MTALAGRVAPVTGAGTRGAAVVFAREGASVVLMDADERTADATAETIRGEGGTWGRLDVLHDNVGVSSVGTVVDVTETEWDRLMAVNVESIMLTTGAAIPVDGGVTLRGPERG